LDTIWDEEMAVPLRLLGAVGTPEQWTSGRENALRQVGFVASASLGWLANPWRFWNKDLGVQIRSNRARRDAAMQAV
jgi:hypothetical protein